jgi:hypothetical protein
MALPSSGPLSISQIRDEEVNNGGFASSYSLRQLSANAGKSTPDSISEFYGYAAATNVYISYYVPSSLTCYNYGNFAAQASAVLNTSLTIFINWFGDLGGFLQANFTLSSGTACNSTSVYTGGSINCVGENVSMVQYGFQCGACTCCPSTFGSQVYGDPNTIPTGGGLYYDLLPC